MKNTTTQNIKAIILGLMLTLGIGYVSAQFAGPTCAPPNCNTDAPINVGASAQVKTGTLTTGGLGILGDFSFLPTGITPAVGQVLTITGIEPVSGAGLIGLGSGAGGGITFLSPTINLGVIPSNSYGTYSMSTYGLSNANSVLLYIDLTSGGCDNCQAYVYTDIGGTDVEISLFSGPGNSNKTIGIGVQTWVPVVSGNIKLKITGNSAGLLKARIIGSM